MKIAVFGTGMVGNTIGAKLVELGHLVMMGSRNKGGDKAMAFVAKNGNRAFEGTYADAASFGELIINCTAGIGSIDALKQAGKANLEGKILIDISNPLDFSKGMPPSLAIVNTNSLGEEIQREFPNVSVVKTLNTMWCGIMVNPMMINSGDHSVFLCGNDHEAKVVVKGILQSFGWHTGNMIDLGDITKSRGTEMYLPLWLSIYGSTNNGAFNIKVVS